MVDPAAKPNDRKKIDRVLVVYRFALLVIILVIVLVIILVICMITLVIILVIILLYFSAYHPVVLLLSSWHGNVEALTFCSWAIILVSSWLLQAAAY